MMVIKSDELRKIHGLVEASPGDSDEKLSEIQFRVMSSKGARRAFKLEGIFWKILELAASSKSQRIGTYVNKIIDETCADINKASLLRVHAANWVSHRLVDSISHSLGNAVLNDIVHAVPTPCMWIDANNSIVGQNQAFLDLLGSIQASPPVQTGDVLRIKFERDLDSIRKNLLSTEQKYIENSIIIRYGTNQTERNVRIVTLKSLRNRSLGLLVFVVD